MVYIDKPIFITKQVEAPAKIIYIDRPAPALAPKRSPSKTYGVKHHVPKKTWCTLSVSFQGSVFSVSFDGKKLFEVEDSTFAAAGKTGLWTKADSVTYFYDFEILETKAK